MARTLNKVQLIGRLGADPETHTTSNGSAVTTFSLATNRQWTAQDGSLSSETDWHRIVAWGTLGDTCAEYLRKGRLIYIEGRLAYRSWETDGQKFQRAEIVASDMLILDSKPEEAPVANPPAAQQQTRRTTASKPASNRSRQEADLEEEMALPF